MGNARTALFNALATSSDDDCFLLRIEDTDKERSKTEFVDALKADLTWLNMHWQEGPEHDQGNGPYFQSERMDIYDKYYDQLLEQDLAYPCFCTPEQLELSRKMQRRQGKPPRYAGTCRHLSQAEYDEKIAEGLQPTLRFKIPENEVVEFEDLVRGKQKFQTNDLGDLIIRRIDGSPTFMFCNAIDDSMMGVTHALRGEDHLTNTPRQLLILKALGLQAPQYGHISLIIGKDGAPLSKRNGSKSIKDLRETGYIPLALINYLARLGHTYTDHNDLMSYDECQKHFDLTRLVKAPAKFDEQQLLHWQKEAVMALSPDQLKTWLNDSLSDVPETQQQAFLTMIQGNILFPSEAQSWVEHLFGNALEFDEEQIEILKATGSEFFEAAESFIQENDVDYKALCDHLKEKCNVKGKTLFMPLRLALTGEKHGPELAPIVELLGKEELIKRFKQAREVSC